MHDELRLDTGLLSDRVYDALRERILAGEFAPGERLVETSLAKRFNVSQAPVRDGLRKLVEAGLARSEPRRGTFVEGVSPKAALDAFHVRAALEPLAVREILAHIDEATLEELQFEADSMLDAAEDGDLSRLLEHDIAFHRIIWWRSQNELLPRVWPMVEKIWPLLEVQVRNRAGSERRFHYASLREVARTHQPLIDALADRDPNTPELFKEHVNTVWSQVEKLTVSRD